MRILKTYEPPVDEAVKLRLKPRQFVIQPRAVENNHETVFHIEWIEEPKEPERTFKIVWETEEPTAKRAKRKTA